jgi:hypothetical protein
MKVNPQVASEKKIRSGGRAVNITRFSNLNLGAVYGSTATIHGNVSITASNSVFLYGLNVTNPAGDAFDINSSHNVTLWTCTANGNSGVGLSVGTLSDVVVQGPGSFDSNGAGGIGVSFHAILNVLAWGGPVDISGNHGAGVGVGDGGLFQTLGNTTIENNINTSTGVRPNGFGIQAVSASKVQVANCFGTSQISGNQSGGIDDREHSQISIWNCGPNGEHVIQRQNAPVVYGEVKDTLSNVPVARAVVFPLVTAKPTSTLCPMVIVWLVPNCVQVTPSGET